MYRKIYASLCLSLLAGVSHAVFNPAVITSGFNQDIIANGIGDAITSASVGFDEANTRALVSMDFQATGSSSFPTYGLPVNGTINSNVNASIIFKLANYNGSNALFLTPSYVGSGTSTGTLGFTAAGVSNIYFLVASAGGDGGLNFTATVHFTDNTTQIITGLAAPDWYGNTGYAIQGIGRVNMTNNNLEGAANNPRLYQVAAAIDVVNQQKTISSVDFSFAGDASAAYASQIRMSVLAITTEQSTQTNQVTISSGFNQDIIVNGLGNASSSATVGFDEANARALLSSDFKVLPTDAAPTSALPTSGLINSSSTSGLSFQLADYNGNNALFLTPSYVTPNSGTAIGTLSFNAANISNLYLLAASAGGDGTPTFNATVSFSDNTTQAFSNVIVPDWYNNSGFAIQGIGRVNMANNAIEAQGTGNPRLYEINLAIDAANQTKTVTGISFNFTGDPLATYANEIRMSVLAISSIPSVGSPTPIVLTSFSGTKEEKGNVLTWTSSHEELGDAYELEHSTDGIQFSTISKTNAKGFGGTYSFLHSNLATGVHFYRLKTTDLNNNSTVSKVISLEKIVREGFSVYPNPVTDKLFLEVKSEGTTTIFIMNLNGQKVKAQPLFAVKGLNTLDVSELASGSYYLQYFVDGNKINTAKFIKK